MADIRPRVSNAKRLPALMIGSLVFQTIQMGVLPILLAQLLNERGVSSFIVGGILAVSWISVLVLGPVVPRLMNEMGNRGAFALAAALTSLALLVLLIETTLLVIAFSAVLAGAGLIIRWIAADTLVVTMSVPAQRGRMIGFHEALMGLGIAIGPLAFVAFDLVQVKLFAIGLCAIGIVLLLFSVGKEETTVDAEDKNEKASGLAQIIIIGLAAAFVAGFIENASVALLPLHYEAYGYGLTTSAIFVSGFGLGGTLLQPPLGYLSDRKGVKFAQGLCIAATILTCTLAAFLPTPPWLVFALVFALGGAVGGLNTLAVIEAGTLLKTDQIAIAMTAIAMAYTLGSVGGPAISGALLDTHYRPAMLIGFIASAALLGVWLLLHKPTDPADKDA